MLFRDLFCSSVLERKPKPDPDAGLTPDPLPRRARASPRRRFSAAAEQAPPRLLAVGLPARASRFCPVSRLPGPCRRPPPAAADAVDNSSPTLQPSASRKKIEGYTLGPRRIQQREGWVQASGNNGIAAKLVTETNEQGSGVILKIS